MEVTIKVNKEDAVVKVKLPKRKGKMRRQRVYTEDAKRLLLEKHPRLELESVLQYCTVKNDGQNEGEWIFALKKKVAKKAPAKKAPTKKTTKKKAAKKKTLKQVKEEAKKVVKSE